MPQSLPIFGVNCVHPSPAVGCILSLTCKFKPLLLYPAQSAFRVRSPHDLCCGSNQPTVAFFTLPQCLSRIALFAVIAETDDHASYLSVLFQWRGTENHWYKAAIFADECV